MATRWTDDGEAAERRTLRRQLAVMVVLLVLLPISVATGNRVFGAVVIGAVGVFTIYMKVRAHRSFRRRLSP